MHWMSSYPLESSNNLLVYCVYDKIRLLIYIFVGLMSLMMSYLPIFVFVILSSTISWLPLRIAAICYKFKSVLARETIKILGEIGSNSVPKFMHPERFICYSYPISRSGLIVLYLQFEPEISSFFKVSLDCPSAKIWIYLFLLAEKVEANEEKLEKDSINVFLLVYANLILS